ncbi:MAG: hypothetical protein JSW58_16735 [Candidatus Latescibacterota bacterium]|nr:MAG: hypothetical protein JSW58_16735 [Candidatus Latescibacterota bacterium]
MFIKQRQVRRSKFTSRFARASRKRREYTASIYAMAVIQGFLFIFLVLGGIRGYEVIRDRFPEAVWYFRLGVPAGMFLIALIVVRSFVGNVRQAIAVSKNQRSTPKTH